VKARTKDRPLSKCKNCEERWELSEYFRRYLWYRVPKEVAIFYLLAIPYMEWRVHAKPGDWIIAGYASWGEVAFMLKETVRVRMRQIVKYGLGEYVPGVRHGIKSTTRLRRFTLDELRVRRYASAKIMKADEKRKKIGSGKQTLFVREHVLAERRRLARANPVVCEGKMAHKLAELLAEGLA
jgi:hypothetical protein